MNKKKNCFFKDELGGKIMKEFVALRPKTYSYLMDGDSEHKKLKEQKCVMKRETKFNNHKNCQFNNEVILKSEQIFKSEKHSVYTEQINKVALCSDDDKKLQTLIKLKHTHMVQMLLTYLKVRC